MVGNAGEEGGGNHEEVAETKCYGLTAAPISHSPEMDGEKISLV